MVQNNKEVQIQKNISKKMRLFFIPFAIFLSLSLAILIGEMFIRLTNIPGIDKNIKYVADPLVGYGYLPRSKLYYCNMRGDVVQRQFNSFGYLDAEHKKEKERGVYRIGFFGGSNVEARQVPLENTFFQIAEKKLDSYNVECMGFGLDGAGTLVAYLNNTRWVPYFDIDLVVYMFAENDPGDNIKEAKEKINPYFPFAVLTDTGYQIDCSNRDRFISYSKTVPYKIHNFLSNHLLLCRVIKDRLKLLVCYGARLPFKAPDPNDLPSTWPVSLRLYAQKLNSAIISKWISEARADARGFVILYEPIETEMKKDTKDQDSWKPYLESFCTENNIPFINPTEDLIRMQRSGKEVFYDHLTIYGHEAFADAFVKWFRERREKS